MASSARVLAIRYTDKVVFVVALGLLGYVAMTSFLLKKTGESDEKLKDIVGLQGSVRKLLATSEPAPEKVLDLTTQLKLRWRKAPEATDLRPWIFHRPRPLVYPVVRMREGETKEIVLRAALVSHQIRGDLTAIRVGANPSGNRVTIVALEQGKAKLVGEDAKRIVHEVPIEVQPPKPPLVVKPAQQIVAEPTLGQIALSWTAPTDQPSEVISVKWQVFRRHEDDEADKFVLVETTDENTYMDTDIKSGEVYHYYVLANATTKEEGGKASELSAVIRVAAKSMVEFYLVSVVSDRAYFEVRRYEEGEWLKQSFPVQVGGLIGGVVRRGRRIIDYSTHCILVDVLLNAPKTVITQRTMKKFGDRGEVLDEVTVEDKRIVPRNKVIFQDRKGNPQAVWQEKAAATGRVTSVKVKDTKATTQTQGTRQGKSDEAKDTKASTDDAKGPGMTFKP